MTARTEKQELVTLRISVARIAQASGVSLAPVGLTDNADYASIHKAALEKERGWNRIAARVVEHLGLLAIAMARNSY